MNPTYNTVLGKDIPPNYSRYNYLNEQNYFLTNENTRGGFDDYEIDNIVNNKRIVKRDMENFDTLRKLGVYDNDDIYDTFEVLDDAGYTEYINGNTKRRSRTIGKIVSPNNDYYDENGNPVFAPRVAIVDPYTGKPIEDPTLEQIVQYGDKGELLDLIEFSKREDVYRPKHQVSAGIASGNAAGGMLAGDVRQYSSDEVAIDPSGKLIPVSQQDNFYIDKDIRLVQTKEFDDQYGWIAKETLETGDNIRKLQLAGQSITSEYGPKTFSTNVFNAFGSGILNTLKDAPRTSLNAANSIANLYNATAEKLRGGDWVAPYTAMQAEVDRLKYERDTHDILNSQTSIKESQGVFDNPVSFSSGLGQGVGSLIEYATIGRLTGAGGLAKAGFNKLAMANLFTVGTIINYGEAYDEAINSGLSNEDAAAIGLATGALASAIELKVGSNKLLHYLTGTGGGRKMSRIITQEIGGDISKLGDKAVERNIFRKVVDAIDDFSAKSVAGTAAEEFTEEYLQGTAKQGMQALYDNYFTDSETDGNGRFGTDPTSWDSIRQNLEEGAIGAILGAGGGALALRNQSGRNNSIAAFVARGEDDALNAGLDQAFSSGALTDDQYNSAKKDIDNMISIRDTNPDLFNVVSQYKPEVRGKVAQTLLENIKSQQDWINSRSDISLGNLDSSNENAKSSEDYILEFESIIDNAIINTFDITDEDGKTSTNIIPTNTLDHLESSLRNAGKVKEADIVDRTIRDSSARTARAMKSLEHTISNVDKSRRAEVKRNMRNELLNSLMTLQFNSTIANEKMDLLSNEISNIYNESTGVSDGISDVASKISEMYSNRSSKAGGIDFSSELINAYNNPVKGVDPVDSVLSILDSVIKDIDNISNANKIVPFINDYTEKLKLRNSILADRVIADESIKSILDNNSNKDRVSKIDNDVARNTELTKSGNKPSVNQPTTASNTDIVGDKPISDNESDLFLSEIDRSIDELVTPNNINYNWDTIRGNSIIDEKGDWKINITDSSGNGRNIATNYNSAEDAANGLKSHLKQYIREVIDRRTKTTVRPNQIDDTEVQDNTTSNDKIQHISNVTSNIQVKVDEDIDSVLLVSHVNNPLMSVAGFANKGVFEISSNFNNVPNRHKESIRAMNMLNTVKSISDWNRLSAVDKDIIIRFIPIQYSFEFESGELSNKRRTIYIGDESSLVNSKKANKKLFTGRYNTRKFIIEQMLSSNDRKFAPSKVDVSRIPGKYNISEYSTPDRSIKINDVKGLRISEDSNGNYVYNTSSNIQFPVRIGIANDDGTVIYHDGTNYDYAFGVGNPGNNYLIFPSKYTFDGVNNRVGVKLNPAKFDAKHAGYIAKLLISLANGSVGFYDKVASDKSIELSVPDNTALTYGKLIEYIIFQGPSTIQNWQTERTDRRIALRNKTLWINPENNLIHYGHNPAAESEFILDARNPSDSDIASFIEWMMANKNMSTSMQSMPDSAMPKFKFGNIESNGSNYYSFMIRNGIVKTDLNHVGQIYKNTVLSIRFPELSIDNKPISSSNNDANIEQPSPAPIKDEDTSNTASAAVDYSGGLSNNKYSKVNYVTPRSGHDNIISRINSVPDSVNTYILKDIRWTQFAKLPAAQRDSHLVSANELLSAFKNIVKSKSPEGGKVRQDSAWDSLSDFVYNKYGNGFLEAIFFEPTEASNSVSDVATTPYSTIAADYLFTGGFDSIGSFDYFIQALIGSFTNASSLISSIRDKYSQRVIDENMSDMSNIIGTDLYNTIISEIRDSIRTAYNNSEADAVFDEILKYPRGMSPKIGNPLATRLENISANQIGDQSTQEQHNAEISQEIKESFADELRRQLEDLAKNAPNPLNNLTVEQIEARNKRIQERRKRQQQGKSGPSAQRSIASIPRLYNKMDANVEKKVYRQILSGLTGGNITMSDKIITMMKESGNARYAWASMNVDGVTLWKAAEKGSIYHEAFHRVSLLYLTSNESKRLYADARIEYNMPSSTDFEIEERLAEEFRSWMLDNAQSKNFMHRIFDSIKNFINQFIFGNKPSYSNIETLFSSIEKGRYQYVKVNKQSVEDFARKYPDENVGFKFNGDVVTSISTTTQFNSIVNELAVALLESNDIDIIASNSSDLSANTEPVLSYVYNLIAEANNDLDALYESDLSESEIQDEESVYYGYINIYNDIIDKFSTVFLPAIAQKLESLGYRSAELQSVLDDMDKDSIFDGIKNDEIRSSYEFSAIDSATADVKLLFSTLLKSDQINPLTGMTQHAPMDEAWFSIFGTIYNSKDINDMINRIRDKGEQLKQVENNNVNIFTSLYDKLIGKASEELKTRVWGTFKKHRYNFVNMYFKKNDDGSVNYSIKNADINRRSVKIQDMWSTMFALDGLYKADKANIDKLLNLKKDWADIVTMAQRGKLKDYNDVSSNILRIFNSLNINIDEQTLGLILQEWTTQELDPDLAKLDLLRKFILDIPKSDESTYGLHSFFNKFLTTKDGVIGREEVEIDGSIISNPEQYLKTQKFTLDFAEKFVSANPSRDDDSVPGPDGNTVYRYSEYNFLTQTFSEFLKNPSYLSSLKSVTYNQKSVWLDYISNNPKSNIQIDTPLSLLQANVYDRGRGYLGISDVEDVMLKFTAIMNNKFPIPTLANKRTYHIISGIPTHKTLISSDKTILNNSDGSTREVNNIKLDNNTVTLFTDYLMSEYNAIQSAKRLRDKFLSDNKLSLQQFNNMTEDEQDSYDYSSLTNTYHYTVKNNKINLSNGNGYKFRYFKSLNSVNESDLNRMFDPDDQSLAKNYIRNVLNRNINETISMLNNLGIIRTNGNDIATNKSIGTDKSGNIIIESNNLLDNRIIKKYASANNFVKNSDGFYPLAMINMIADYAINTAISTIEFEKILSGDLAYYKDEDTRVKRYSAMSSTGTILRQDFDDDQYGISKDDFREYSTVTFKSNIINSDRVYNNLLDKYIGKDNKSGLLYDRYIKLWDIANNQDGNEYPRFKDIPIEEVGNIARRDAEERLSSYKKVDQTDAQTFITPLMYKKIMIMLGDWSDTKEEAYQLLESDKELTTDEQLIAYTKVIMPPLKMVYYGANFKNNNFIPIYDKMSLAVIFKRMATGSDMENIYNSMINNGVDMIKFDSAVKSGGAQAIKAYDRDTQEFLGDNISKNISRLKQQQSFSFLRRQLNTDPHESGHSALGTQAAKIGFAGVDDSFDYNINGNEVKGSTLKSIYKDSIDELTRRGYSVFSDRFGILDNKVDKSKFIENIKYRAMSSGQDANMIDSLGYDKSTNRYTIEPSLIPGMKWIQSSILSMIKGDIIDINLPGGSFIQRSNFALKDSKIKVINIPSYSFNKELKFRDPSNRQEAIVSINLFKQFLPRITMDDGKPRDMTYYEARQFILDNDITIMVYRIPTQSQGSVIPLHIVDFLPESEGDTIILPAEFTTLTGSDFDIDKLYAVLHNYIMDDNGDLVPVKYDINTPISDMDTEQIENMLLDAYLSVLTSDNHLIETTTPLDAVLKPILEVKDKIDSLNNKNKHDLYTAFPLNQEAIKAQNVGADSGIAPMALSTMNHVLTSISGVSMNTSIEFKNTLNIVSMYGVGPLDRKYDKNGILIYDWLSAMVSAHVDAAKDPYILKMNVNSFTYDVTGLLLRSGFGDTTFYFLPQPILVDLANEYHRLDVGQLGLSWRERKKINWRKSIYDKYKSVYDTLAEKENFDPSGIDIYSKEMVDKLSNNNWLWKQIATPEESRDAEWYFNQLAIFDHYDQLSKYARELSNMVSKTKIDTAKYGNNASLISSYLNGISNMLNSEYFNNPINIFDNTFLGEKLNYGPGKFFEVFGNEMIEISPKFIDIVNRMLRETGNFNISNPRIINMIQDEVSKYIRLPFIHQYASENNIDIKELFFGENSVVLQHKELMDIANSSVLLMDLRNNEFMKLLKANSTDFVSSIKNGKPMMFNASVSKNRDAGSLDEYVSGFRDILTHRVPAVRSFANRLLIYSYITSGGVTSGINNIVRLVPYDILANLTLKNGTTFNDHIRNSLELFNNDDHLDDKYLKDLISSAYRSLAHEPDIVPVVGEINHNGIVMEGKYINSSQNNKGAKSSPYIFMSSKFADIYNNGINSLKQSIFQPIVRVNNESNPNDYTLYEYIGYIDNNEIITPIYKQINPIGYRDRTYFIKELDDSIISNNNKYNPGNKSYKLHIENMTSHSSVLIIVDIPVSGISNTSTSVDNNTSDYTESYSEVNDDASSQAAAAKEPNIFYGKMSFLYNGNSRKDVTSKSTIDAIENGERTATTRYESQGNIDYWKRAKVGDIIEFSNGEKSVSVIVTSPLQKLSSKFTENIPEQWSKLEGWSTEYFSKRVLPKINEAWQIEYKYINNSGGQLLNTNNDYIRPFYYTLGSSIYKFDNIEQAFQSAKAHFVSSNSEIIDTKDRLRYITSIRRSSQQDAKRIGMSIPMSEGDIKLWDNISYDIMKNIIREYFTQNKNAIKELLMTGNSFITNNQSNGRLENYFSSILMSLRDEFSSNELLNNSGKLLLNVHNDYSVNSVEEKFINSSDGYIMQLDVNNISQLQYDIISGIISKDPDISEVPSIDDIKNIGRKINAMIYGNSIALMRDQSQYGEEVNKLLANRINSALESNNNISFNISNDDANLIEYLDSIDASYNIIDKPNSSADEFISYKESMLNMVDQLNKDMYSDVKSSDLISMINSASTIEELAEIMNKYICI